MIPTSDGPDDELQQQQQQASQRIIRITPLPSAKKRPIPFPSNSAYTHPPPLQPGRPVPLLAAARGTDCSCLDGSATALVPRMGMPNEHWTILPLLDENDDAYAKNGAVDEQEEGEEQTTTKILCYGAPVRIQNHRGEYLNVTAVDPTTDTTSDDDDGETTRNHQRALSISASTTWDHQDPSTIWTFHPSTGPIPVGPITTPDDLIVPPIYRDRPVRFAQAFCLRNAEWNGVLESRRSLQLLTDAHEQPIIAATEDFDVEDHHPMGRLWQAHLFIPSVHEIWYAQEPPDPDYRGGTESYTDQGRLEETLFGRFVEPVVEHPQPSSMETNVQETILLDELLGACMGLSGDYIQFDGEKYRLLPPIINNAGQRQQPQPWDTIVHTTVTDLLEIPNAYKSVEAALKWQRHHDCPVRRALYEELQDWLDEYLEVILCQYRDFREGKLSIHNLQALNVERIALNTMVKICQLPACGGALIRSLPKIPRLLRAVMVPYQEQLQAWVTQGRLIAPDHFMVQRNSDKTATAWEDKYAVHQGHVLPDLLPSDRMVQQTLATGRYWNAVRTYHAIPSVQNSAEMSLSLTAFIERQHELASAALKGLLLPDLRPSLQLIESYFLMYKADMFLDFLEKASVDLGKDIELISRHRIQHIFSEPRIQCVFQRNSNNATTISSNKIANGLDAFTIRLTNLSYPSTIMLTRNVMLHYSSLFRHLFKVKFAEQKLLSVWKDHQLTKDLSILPLLTSTFALRHRMQHFVSNLEYYLRFEVVELQWGKFLLDIDKESNTVDDMLAIQHRFLDNVLEACMLKDRKARLALTVLLDTCILFTTQMDNFHNATKLKVHDPSRRRLEAVDSIPPTPDLCRERLEMAQELREQRRDIQSSRLEQGASAASYRSMVSRFSDAFDRRLKDFVATLSTQHVSLYTRLNFNGFLSDPSDGASMNGHG